MKNILGILFLTIAFLFVACRQQPPAQDQDEETVIEQEDAIAPAPATPPVTAPQTQEQERIEADTLKDDQVTTPQRRGATEGEAEQPTRRGATQESEEKEKEEETSTPRRRGS